MRKQVASASTIPGFVLLDSALNPIVVNRIAAEALGFPQKPESTKHFDDLLVARIRSALLSVEPNSDFPIVGAFQSGKRRYSCRSFRLDATLKSQSRPKFAVLIERGDATAVAVAQASEKYHLTPREGDVLRLLLGGLTSKEIAQKLEISTNTVKAFMRLLMIKMRVSTRSGIVSKTLIPKD